MLQNLERDTRPTGWLTLTFISKTLIVFYLQLHWLCKSQSQLPPAANLFTLGNLVDINMIWFKYWINIPHCLSLYTSYFYDILIWYNIQCSHTSYILYKANKNFAVYKVRAFWHSSTRLIILPLQIKPCTFVYVCPLSGISFSASFSPCYKILLLL